MSASNDPRVPLGRSGVELAERFLLGRGHAVLARRFRVAQGEVDLVTLSGAHLYFVEVKTRRSARYGGGIGSLSAAKRRRMARVAEAFVARRGLHDLVPHLSLLTVEPADDRAALHFLPDAFDAA